jgi:hypothetical protein
MYFRDTQGDYRSCSALIGKIKGVWTWIISKAKRAITICQQNNGGQYVKIYITFFQILGSFDMFDITWPALFTVIIQWIKGMFQFDVLRLPAASCMWIKVTFDDTLHTYTIAPLGAIAMLGLPVVVGKYLRGLPRWSQMRMRETIDRFWTNLMFLLFLLYPAMSMATMLVFNCDPHVGRLREDYRVVCPHAMTSLSFYSIVFFVLYPFGIPVMMHVALRLAGVPEVAREKVQQAEWAAMLSLFVKRYVSIEMQSFCRLIGNVDGEDFTFQCRQKFDQLLALQDEVEDSATPDPGAGEDGDTLLLSKLKYAIAGGRGMKGTSIDGLVVLLEQYDVNGNGKMDFDQFCTLIKDVRAKTNLFTGCEDVNALTEKQMDTLLLYHRWPTKHEGPADLGEAEGIRQLIDQNKKETGQDEDDVEAERAQRRANLAEGGDRSDPELESIDEMWQEFMKREQEGHISEEYMCEEHGWRNDMKEAEDLYVEDPRKVDAFLETIHVRELPTDEKRSKVLRLAHDLVVRGITAIPPLVWQQSTGEEQKRAVDRKDMEGDPTDAEEEDVEPPKDQLLISRFGFLFMAYRINFWWWEGVEMLRKLLMTSLLVFVMPGKPGQLAAAAMITFCFLLLNLMCQPFCTPGLNSLSTFTLVAQFATLVSEILSRETATSRVRALQHLLFSVCASFLMDW